MTLADLLGIGNTVLNPGSAFINARHQAQMPPISPIPNDQGIISPIPQSSTPPTGPTMPQMFNSPIPPASPTPQPTAMPTAPGATWLGPTVPPTLPQNSFAPGTPAGAQYDIYKASNKTGVPMQVLSAVGKHESAGTFLPDKKQIGFGKGYGTYQIDLGQHPEYTPDYVQKNGAEIAARLLAEGNRVAGTWHDALRYYNGGPGYDSNRRGYNGKPVKQITEGYANKVESLEGR